MNECWLKTMCAFSYDKAKIKISANLAPDSIGVTRKKIFVTL